MRKHKKDIVPEIPKKIKLWIGAYFLAVILFLGVILLSAYCSVGV